MASLLPVMCTNHDQGAVIGRAVRAESLPDAHRVVGKFSDFADVPAARTAFANIRDKVYPGFSFHFVRRGAGAHTPASAPPGATPGPSWSSSAPS